MTILISPAHGGLLLPLAAAALLAGLIRLAGGAGRGARLADSAVGLAFLLAFIALFGSLPVLGHPPHALIAETAALGTALGLILTLAGRDGRIAAIVAPLALVLWRYGLALPHLPWGALLPAIAFAAGGVAVMRQLQASTGRGAVPMVLSGVAALGLAGIAAFFAAEGVMRLALALAAALAGFLAWNWPSPRWPLGPAGWLAVGGALLAMALSLGGESLLSLVPLSLLALVFFVEPAAARLGAGSGLIGRALAPVVLAFTAAVPALAAIGAALLLGWLS
jgi:hypothetical protein